MRRTDLLPKPAALASALLLACLGGCSTLKGAPDALINLAGQSTQSRFQGKYLEQEEVRSYFRLDPQHTQNLRLSYDGRSLPANEIRQQNVVLIPALQNYLQSIVERLAKGWPGEQPQLRITVTDSYSFGPSADPYGNLYVPLGMLESVESEDEIAAMLAHEMSHVLLRHHDRRQAFNEQRELLTNIATTAVIATMVADSRLDRGASKWKVVSKNPQATQRAIGDTVLYTSLANTFSDNVWNTAWGRAQEDQADLLGTDLLIRAHYAPRGASHSLQRLSDFQGKQEPLMAGFIQARRSAMQDSLQRLDLHGFTQEINTFVNQGLMTTVSAVGQHLTRSHMSAQRRDDDLRHYLQREYDAERYNRVNKRNWLTVRNAPSVKASLDAYRNAYGANEALAQKNLKDARTLAERALKSPVANQPGIRRSLFNVHMASGDKRRALAQLNAIKDWSLAGPEVYEQLVHYHLNNGDAGAALATIERAERHLGSQEQFIVEKMLAHKLKNNESELRALSEKCKQMPNRKEVCKKLG